MQAFTQIDGLVVPLMRSNIDTDAIIPKQFLKSIKRSGFGINLFDAWRYTDPGFPGQDVNSRQPNTEFVLNAKRYQGAKILLTGQNFGCGSSREHAVWALDDYGIRCVIAPSFGEIFNNNAFKSGLLPLVLDASIIEQLANACKLSPGYHMQIDLATQTVTAASGEVHAFAVDPFRKNCLLNGLDDIGLTLQHRDKIAAFEAQRRSDKPWLFR